MKTIVVQTLTLVTFLVLVLILIERKTTPNTLHQNIVSISSPISPLVKYVAARASLGAFSIVTSVDIDVPLGYYASLICA
ncbi:hypothetical protein CR513_23232, partial [Mucuna pruriens]